MNVKVLAIAIAAVGLVWNVSADVKLGAPFGDGMVLQREMEVPVWGTCLPCKVKRDVVVEFAGQKKVAEVDGPSGRWRVTLDPMEASSESRKMVVRERIYDGFLFPWIPSTRDEVEVKDVLVGEVWLAAGQSNMELPLVSENPRFRDRKGAMLAQYVERPYVRIANVSDYRWSPEPRKELRSPIAWRKVEPGVLGGNRAVSACAFYYALELYGQLGIPIGIVEARWGGTNIDAWTPRVGYEGIAELADVASARIYRSMEEGFTPYAPVWDLHQQPTALWNEMVEPLCPMAARGFIWYQGCHNIGEWQRYCAKMHALYNGWAKKFENPALKLYFVQLAPWGVEAIAKMQQEQARFDEEEPNAEMAVINDIGNIHDVHPAEKQLVAQRLALHAFRRDYGYTAIRDRSPKFVSGRAEGDKAILSFDEADGLYVYNDDRSIDVGFELAGEDGVFRPAHIDNFRGKDDWVTGVVAGKKLILYADGVAAPRKVRYLHARPWKGTVYNEANLPLGAFEADLDASEETRLAARREATAWMQGKVGAFTHYLMASNDFPRVGEFDVKGLVGQLKAMKASYYVLTLGQNTGYYCAPNATYERIAGYGLGERCARRDIPREIIEELRGTGIRFGLYLPGQPANRDGKAEAAFGFTEMGKWNDRMFNRAGAENWAKVIREWSSRYGDGVSLWWFDGCYDHLDFNDEYARLYRDAVHVGNPDAVVAFNEGVRLKSAECQGDYWAGEENEPFDLWTESRLRRSGQQWQVLTFLGSTWGKSDMRYPVEKWREWIKSVTSKGGAVTLDMNIAMPQGLIDAGQADAFARVSRN